MNCECMIAVGGQQAHGLEDFISSTSMSCIVLGDAFIYTCMRLIDINRAIQSAWIRYPDLPSNLILYIGVTYP